jgi:hypothetical protein
MGGFTQPIPLADASGFQKSIDVVGGNEEIA